MSDTYSSYPLIECTRDAQTRTTHDGPPAFSPRGKRDWLRLGFFRATAGSGVSAACRSPRALSASSFSFRAVFSLSPAFFSLLSSLSIDTPPSRSRLHCTTPATEHCTHALMGTTSTSTPQHKHKTTQAHEHSTSTTQAATAPPRHKTTAEAHQPPPPPPRAKGK